MARRQQTKVAAAHSTRRSSHPTDERYVVLTIDVSGIIQSATDDVSELFGWAPSEIIGEHYKTLLPHTSRASDARTFDEFVRNASGTRKSSRESGDQHYGPIRFQALRKVGSEISVEMAAAKVSLPHQSAPLFVVMIWQVGDNGFYVPTDSHSLHQKLSVLASQTRAVSDVHLSLRLRDRMSAIGTLAAGLGHDMNNALLPMRGHLNAIAARHALPSAGAHLESVLRSVSYLQQLSDGLHYLSLDPKTENGKPATNLPRWWEQVGGLLAKAVPSYVKVKATLPRTLPSVSIAPHTLTQAMLNLVVNAGEAIDETRPARGSTGKASKEPDGRVHIWAKQGKDKSTVILGMTDNGRGMKQEVLRRAFELFFTTKTRGLGTGLGLALVQRVVAGAGGSVEIESEPGKGTTVSMTLPVAETSSAEDEGSFGGPISRVIEDGPHRHAVLSISNGRVAAMVRLMLEATVRMGGAAREGQIPVQVMTGQAPGDADIWATDPTSDALRAAAEWHAGQARKRIVLSGPPPREDAQKWSELGAFNIEDGTDLDSIRSAVRQALTI